MDALPVPVSSNRDWSELPLDVLSFIFTKLGPVEVLMHAGIVCHTWLDAAQVPDLWRSVEMEHHLLMLLGDKYLLRAMAVEVINRSGGQLEEFAAKRFVDDELHKYVAERSPSLKALRLVSCYELSAKGFTDVMRMSPLLDLRSLELVCLDIGKKELTVVLGNCPRLKSIYVSNYCNIVDDDDLRVYCARIEHCRVTMQSDSEDEDFSYHPDSEDQWELCTYIRDNCFWVPSDDE